MAEPTQLACMIQYNCVDWNGNVLIKSLDRTLKAIGVLNAAPVYEPLPGFERYAPVANRCFASNAS